MSLSNPSAVTIVKKQFQYKTVAYLDHFFSLVIMQLLALFFSYGGVGSTGVGSNNFYYQVNYYSADGVIVFSMIWGLITGIYITTKSFRYDDFSFVTNRLASNISNSLFLLFASIFAGASAMLTAFLQRVVYYFFGNGTVMFNYELMEYNRQALMGIGASILHVLLFCALGYLIGSFVQVHKILAFIIPALFFFLLKTLENENFNMMQKLFRFYYQEASFILFTVKVILTVLCFFILSAVVTNRLEVKR